MMTPQRRRLPNRRPAVTEDIALGDMRLIATIGFDPAGAPAEVFLSGAKDGSGMAAILADAAVVISIALQHGIPAAALRKSMGRLPAAFDGPLTMPASPIGAALDLIARYEAAAP
jgi:ribonucleoside-diphosphate reductase alpha chain